MSSLLQSPFMEDSISEVVPEVAKVAGKLSAASVITARRRMRIVPQSGQTYTVGAAGAANTINILLQDGQAYLDPLSAVLSFEVDTWDSANGAGTSVVGLDDGAYSVFRRALISVNSTLMDDCDFVPKKVNAELYATVGQEWYNTVGSMMGLYKYSTTVYGTNDVSTSSALPTINTNGFIDKYAMKAKQALQAATTQVSGPSAAAPGRNKFFVPLCLLSSFFRNETLLPLRNVGQLYVQLNLASALEACVAQSISNTNPISPNFRIKNLTLECDFVDLHPTYLAMMDEIMERPDEDGVRWAFDAHLVSAQNFGGAGSGNGPQSIIISKASQNMRSIQCVFQSQPGLSAVTYPKQSTFSNPGFVDIQARVGSLYFPAFTTIGEHRCFADLQNAFGSPASLDKSGVMDLQTFYGATKSDGNVSTVAPYNPPAYQAYADGFSWAYCFDKLKHAVLRGIDLDGINTLTSSGSQIVIQVNQNSATVLAEAIVLTGIVRFTRILEVKGGATRVIG